jgi:hypothetical protein
MLGFDCGNTLPKWIKRFMKPANELPFTTKNKKDDKRRRALAGGARHTGRFIMFSVITNILNKKTKRPILMELFTATEKLKKVFFDNYS